MTEWYRLDAQEAVEQINSDLQNGLTAAEAARRLAEYGPNELVERGTKAPGPFCWSSLRGSWS